MKLPFFPFYPLDWLRDTRPLSPEAKGAWIDVLAIAWNEPARGVYKRWPDMMMRDLGVLERDQLESILGELDGVATIEYSRCDDPECTTQSGEPNAPSHECNGEITIISRRMVKIEKAYKLNAERQRRHYNKRKPNAQSNDDLTPKTLDVRRHQRLTSTSSAAARGASLEATRQRLAETAKEEPMTEAQMEEAEAKARNQEWQRKLPEIPESERMTPEEMKAIRLKNFGPLKSELKRGIVLDSQKKTGQT
jgi:hypothetical protein